MAAPITETVERIRVKSALLQERYQSIRAELEAVRSANTELVEDNNRLQKEIESLRLENEYLRLSHKVAPTEADVDRSKQLISNMMQKVDKCIEYLNQM